ncbi:toll/interleukin-1 receptor domain-containing protein [Cryptosporangium japonicum]
MGRRIFVSYARENRAAVSGIEEDLTAVGHEVWSDGSFSGGEIWWSEILEHISWCDVFLLALSDAALYSPACRLEHQYALDLRRPVLPVRVALLRQQISLPGGLGEQHQIDYHQGGREATLELQRAIARAPVAPEIPPDVPVPPTPGADGARRPSAHVVKCKGTTLEVDIMDGIYRGRLKVSGNDGWDLVKVWLDDERWPTVLRWKGLVGARQIHLWLPHGRELQVLIRPNEDSYGKISYLRISSDDELLVEGNRWKFR